MSLIRITQVKSGIDRMERQKRTLRALGFKKVLNVVEVEATPQILGMVRAVHHLVKVEPISQRTITDSVVDNYRIIGSAE